LGARSMRRPNATTALWRSSPKRALAAAPDTGWTRAQCSTGDENIADVDFLGRVKLNGVAVPSHRRRNLSECALLAANGIYLRSPAVVHCAGAKKIVGVGPIREA
jgi:hypothetical protein